MEKLGEIVTIKKGKKQNLAKTKSDSSRRYIQIGDLRNNNSIKYTDDDKGIIANSRDVLIAWDGANAGQIGYNLNGIIGSTLARLRLKEGTKIHPIFLGKLLESKFAFLRRTATGATIPHISRKALESINIPKIDFVDQKRIAQVLSDCEALIELRKESIGLLDELVKSTFLEMFGDPSYNHKDFKVITVRDLLTEAKYGTSNKAQEGGEYPYLRMNNIDYNGNWDFEKLKYINLEEKDKPKYLLKKGDVVFNRTNSKELVGKTGIYDRNTEMCIAGYLIRLRTLKDVNPYYLWAHLNSTYSKQNLFSMCRNIVGMANINAQEIQDFKCLDVPQELGNQFEEKVEEINSLKAIYQSHLLELENLYARLSQDAFKGELDLSGVVLKKEIVLEASEEYQNRSNDKHEKTKYSSETNSEKKSIEVLKLFYSMNKIDIYFKYFLKTYFAETPFTFNDVKELLQEHEYVQYTQYEYDEWKGQFFLLLNQNKPFIQQFFDSEDGVIKFKLINEIN